MTDPEIRDAILGYLGRKTDRQSYSLSRVAEAAEKKVTAVNNIARELVKEGLLEEHTFRGRFRIKKDKDNGKA